MRDSIHTSLTRWRLARRAVLGAIVVAGAVATSTAVIRTVALSECPGHAVERAYTYSGIGVVIERDGSDTVVVKQVLPGAPAEGILREGMRLVAVDGEAPPTVDAWAAAIRGAPGTSVELEVAFPCGGHKSYVIARDIVRMSY